MSKNEVKPEAAEPYTEQTSLGGPIPVVMGGGPMACRMKISGKALQAAGMKPNDQIELIAGAGEIRIRKIGDQEPSIWSASEPKPSARKIQLDALMEFARERQARARGEYDDEDPEKPLNAEQISQGEL